MSEGLPPQNMEIGKVQKRSITEEMKESYLDYAMSVIISRALPDVRDGLKPVQRRILYSMWEEGLKSSAKFRKSATVVGACLGRYHPHGDIPVYDALVRMAQDFSLRYPLIQGQGNFGSIDSDPPAAQRYTECKLSKIAEEMLYDIEKETVPWVDNYDGTRKEPSVLPAKIPQLLLNGCMGIAVGMATNIPSHNLSELVDAIIYKIDNPNATTEDLFNFIQGPDFPTGGIIYDRKGMISAYSTGKGPITMRAKTEIAESKKGRFQIIITEIPYGVNKAGLVERIAELVKNKKIQGIRDIRDESDKEGIRVVIDLKPDIAPQRVLNRLFKLTDLQKVFHLNMLALVDGIQPQVLSLPRLIEEFIKHRQEVVTRRTQFDLNCAKHRAHILEGLKKALDYIDDVIDTIKRSKDREIAHKNLMKKFKLTDIQATAILEMKLQSLAGLERKKILQELKEKLEIIKKLTDLLKSPKKILGVVKKELKEIKEKYKDERRTKVVIRALRGIKEEETIPNEECIIILTRNGYIKRVNPKIYKAQRRGGTGVIGIAPRKEDAVNHFVFASTLDNILFFTDKGKVFQTKAYEIPEAGRLSKGQAIVNIISINPDERITAVLPLSFKESKYLIMATRNGVVKKTCLEEFSCVRRNGLIAIRLEGNDVLEWANATSGKDEILLITQNGQSIRFKERDIRPMGRNASGVIGIRLAKEDKVVGMGVVRKHYDPGSELLVITENGFGKKTDLRHYKLQRRGGKGIKTARLTDKTGKLICGLIIKPEQENLMVISKKGHVIKIKIKDIPNLSRATKGVKIMRLKAKDKVASVIGI